MEKNHTIKSKNQFLVLHLESFPKIVTRKRFQIRRNYARIDKVLPSAASEFEEIAH